MHCLVVSLRRLKPAKQIKIYFFFVHRLWFLLQPHRSLLWLRHLIVFSATRARNSCCLKSRSNCETYRWCSMYSRMWVFAPWKVFSCGASSTSLFDRRIPAWKPSGHDVERLIIGQRPSPGVWVRHFFLIAQRRRALTFRNNDFHFEIDELHLELVFPRRQGRDNFEEERALELIRTWFGIAFENLSDHCIVAVFCIWGESDEPHFELLFLRREKKVMHHLCRLSHLGASITTCLSRMTKDALRA